MGMRIFLGILGVVIGIVGGMIFMMSLHMASTYVYPLPEGVSFTSQEPDNVEKLREWFSTLPAGAFALAIVCHGLGCMAGAFVASLISGRRSMIPAWFVGAFFTVGGIANLFNIPHPPWFPFADLPVYLILATVAGRLLLRPDDQKISAQS